MDSLPEQPRWNSAPKFQVTASALIILAVTLSCSLTSRLFPAGIPLLGPSAPLGRIAYVGTDYNIYTIDRDGKQKQAITQDANPSPGSGDLMRLYQFPTWAPNGRSLAFMSFTGSGQGGSQAILYTALSDGTRRVNAFSKPDTTPFYLLWSPNSDYVTLLSDTTGGTDLDLYLAPAAGGDSQLIGTGSPFYWDWSPDNSAIIVHIGGATMDNPDARLAVIKLGDSIQKKELDLRPGNFQAPAWSAGGDLLLTVSSGVSGGDQLVLAGPDGTVKHVLVQTTGPLYFALSPQGDSLAYMAPLPSDPSGQTDHLVLLNRAKPDQGKEITQGVVLAFFWSPDGQKIAYFVFDPAHPTSGSPILVQSAPRISLEVEVYDLRSGKTSQVTTFSPTDAFQQVIPYFDQYQRSGTIWSPDSKDIVLSSVDAPGIPGIYVVDIAAGKSQKIANGDLAFWAWK